MLKIVLKLFGYIFLIALAGAVVGLSAAYYVPQFIEAWNYWMS